MTKAIRVENADTNDFKVVVEVWVTRLGNKSLDMTYCMLDSATGIKLATANTTLVTFDYHTNQTISIPDLWRGKISAIDSL